MGLDGEYNAKNKNEMALPTKKECNVCQKFVDSFYAITMWSLIIFPTLLLVFNYI